MSDFSKKVYDVVSEIPRGQTMTYKQVAEAAGSPNAARAVGNALNKNPDTKNIPCHRVIKSKGDIGGYVFGRDKKVQLLKSEGVI